MEKLGRHRETADTYMSIGMILQAQDNDEKAEEMFQKALDIKLKILPYTDPEVTELYHHLAHSLKKQDKYSESTKIHKLQLATLLQVHGEDHPGVVLSYHGIAELLALQHRSEDALQMLDRGIEIRNRLELLKADFVLLLGQTFSSIAVILSKQGNVEAATGVLNKALIMQIETVGERHYTTVQTYAKLAVAYGQLAEACVKQDIEGAIKSYAKAIKFRRKELGNEELGDDHPEVKKLMRPLELLRLEKKMRDLNELGLAMKADGDSEKAMQLFNEALDICLENSLIGPTTAALLENMSAIRVDQGKLGQAVATSAEALKIRRRMHGDDHADTK
ncbi:unnamed protein product [Cylindrotheca closterium]|uniref:MalT-like TPR region domain-containing protein n=1 Tax=Cylindrotheca closterium TaxID=2856 RepID=A0AAD2CDW5_9STRA|nr:unnamed protein product [Cylindrotheca closterium]